MTAAAWLDAVIGQREGFLALTFGRRPYWNERGRYEHKDWTETRFRWPSEMGKIAAAVNQELAAGEPVDIYVCPAVRFTSDRRKGSALPPMVCWADMDGPPADIALWDTLNPLVVDSGQPGHLHAYVPLTRPVGLGAHARLNKALAGRLGADAKWSDESLLRLPGSLNFKPATPRNGEPAGKPARVLARPWSGTPWDPDQLAELLGVNLDQPNNAGSSQTVDGEPVDVATLPAWLRDRLNNQPKPKDASESFHGLVGACRDAGLTQGQTVTVMGGWRHLPDRYQGRAAAEVARSWAKVRDKATTITATAAGLPDEFWSKRKWLEHVRQAGWSRGCSAEATLGAVLPRIAAQSSHFIKLPAPVGSPVGLTLLTGLVGPPGAAKSSSATVAVDLLPADKHSPLTPDADEVQVSSGEGLIDVLFDVMLETGPGGNQVKVKRQTRYNLFAYIDEGETLARQAKRNGQSTVLPTLRTAFTDGPLGQANATAELKRRVPRGRYVLGVVLGMQPAKADDLFTDAGAGTPQRFLWMPADAEIPEPSQRPDWPGALTRPKLAQVNLDAADPVTDEVRWNHYRRRAGCDPLDEHADLIRFKVAGVFAVMDGDHTVTEEHWALAGAVMDCSNATRARLLAEISQQRQQTIRSRGEADAVRLGIVEERTDERAMAAAKRQAVGKVVKHHRGHPEGSCSRRCITQGIASKYRATVSVDDVIDRAVAEDLLAATTDGRYTPGKRTSV